MRLRFEAYTAQVVVQDAMQVYFFAQPDVQPRRPMSAYCPSMTFNCRTDSL